jgi:hypothetical protein
VKRVRREPFRHPVDSNSPFGASFKAMKHLIRVIAGMAIFVAVPVAAILGPRALPKLKPLWSIEMEKDGQARIVSNLESIFVAGAQEVTCISKANGSIRWTAKLSPTENQTRYPRPSRMFLCDEVLCVERQDANPLVDIVDLKSGAIRKTLRFTWQRISGIVGFGRFAVVCTKTHNYPGRVQVWEIDLHTGRLSQGVSPYVLRSFWRPYYAIGGDIFRVEPERGLVHIPIFKKTYSDHTAPKKVWFLTASRVLTSDFDEDDQTGSGVQYLCEYSLDDPTKELRKVAGPNGAANDRKYVGWTSWVVTIQSEVWLYANTTAYRLLREGFVEAKFLPYKLRGLQATRGSMFAFGVKGSTARDKLWQMVLFKYARKDQFKPVAEFPPSPPGFARFYPLGETVLRDTFTDVGFKKHRLELFRIIGP